ncbi:hypothetical protein C8J57DRAFT_1239203 [Mycena rebaudengoi]|nr:hypothetical protein C8J57DRAFT_1239203 [Mycena rebaudengoi]
MWFIAMFFNIKHFLGLRRKKRFTPLAWECLGQETGDMGRFGMTERILGKDDVSQLQFPLTCNDPGWQFRRLEFQDSNRESIRNINGSFLGHTRSLLVTDGDFSELDPEVLVDAVHRDHWPMAPEDSTKALFLPWQEISTVPTASKANLYYILGIRSQAGEKDPWAKILRLSNRSTPFVGVDGEDSEGSRLEGFFRRTNLEHIRTVMSTQIVRVFG